MELAMRGTIAPRTTQRTKKVKEKAKVKAKAKEKIIRKARKKKAVIQPAKAVGRTMIIVSKTAEPRVQARTETKEKMARRGKEKAKEREKAKARVKATKLDLSLRQEADRPSAIIGT